MTWRAALVALVISIVTMGLTVFYRVCLQPKQGTLWDFVAILVIEVMTFGLVFTYTTYREKRRKEGKRGE